MSLKSHALHHISIITILSCILDVYNWLCAGKIGLSWAHDAISFACHMFMHPHAYVLLCQYTCYISTVWSFSDCLSLPSLFLFMLLMSMAPKRKSTPSQNPLRSRASSSSDPTPSHIWFRDEDAQKDFSENFSRQGVHSERQVILSDFSNTNLPTVIHSRDLESQCDVPVTPFVLIQEFYSNMHRIDSSAPLFHTRIRGTHIVVTSQLVTDVLHFPRV